MKIKLESKQGHDRLRQNGTTLAEMGLYLVIVAILGVVAFSYFQDNTLTAQSQQLATDLQKLSGQVKANYANNYGLISNEKLHSGSFFKNLPSLNDNAGSITLNVGGGALRVLPGSVTTSNDSVKYELTQLPDTACKILASLLSKTVTTLKIGDSKIVKAAGAVADPSSIACSADNNSITYQVQ